MTLNRRSLGFAIIVAAAGFGLAPAQASAKGTVQVDVLDEAGEPVSPASVGVKPISTLRERFNAVKFLTPFFLRSREPKGESHAGQASFPGTLGPVQ